MELDQRDLDRAGVYEIGPLRSIVMALAGADGRDRRKMPQAADPGMIRWLSGPATPASRTTWHTQQSNNHEDEP
jgi:hypothetical protein